MTKRVCSLLLAVLLLVALLVVPASAESTITITINNEAENHVYHAYQVFAGVVNESGIMTNIVWGNGVNGDALLAALKTAEQFTDDDGTNLFAGCANAEAVSNLIKGWSYNEPDVKNFADVVADHLSDEYTESVVGDGKYVITVEDDGYYLVKDAQAVSGADAATDYLLQVVRSVEVAPKISAPTFRKTVNNELDSTYLDAIDAQIGDTVYFKLETTLPSLYNDYRQYRMVMQDVMPEGLEFNRVEDIYIVHAAGGHTSYLENYTPDDTVTIELTDSKEYGYNAENSTLTVNFGDLKLTQSNPNLNDTFVVKYSATVTADAVFGLAGDLGNKNTATLLFSNNMNQADAATADLGSLTDTASVYAYQLMATKQDDLTKAAIANAGFVLYREVSSTVEGTTTITKMYAVTDEDGVIQSWTADKQAATTRMSDAEGKFSFSGLDSLAYYLEETVTPGGYNTMKAPVLVTLSAEVKGEELTALSCTADGTGSQGNVADGSVAITVFNTPGSSLPATGGMGTTIFYIAGAAMLLAVAMILVAKKRREA